MDSPQINCIEITQFKGKQWQNKHHLVFFFFEIIKPKVYEKWHIISREFNFKLGF